MTRERAKVLYDRILKVLAARGIAVDARATPADIAAEAARLGESRVRTFVDGVYYPLVYGSGATTLADGDAEDLVHALEAPVVVDRRAASDAAGADAGACAVPSTAAPVASAAISGSAPDAATQAAAARPTSAPIVRNWVTFVFAGGFGLALTGLAVGMLVTGESKLQAGGVGLLALGALMMAASARIGHCPRCGDRVEIAVGAGSDGVAPCYRCDDYVCVVEDRLSPVPPGFVAVLHPFEVRWEKAPPVAEWVWPWADRCAVCAAPTESTAGQIWNPNDRFGLPGGTRIAIPGCADHALGVRVMYPLLHFRSYDHWRAFRAANGLERARSEPDS